MSWWFTREGMSEGVRGIVKAVAEWQDYSRTLVDVAAGRRANATRRLMITLLFLPDAASHAVTFPHLFFLDPITVCIGEQSPM